MYFLNSHKSHKLLSDLNQVHSILNTKYNLEQQAAIDVVRAQKMEQYLRNFKRLGTNENAQQNNIVQMSLEEQAMQTIAQEVGKRLGIGQKNSSKGYNLFGNEHMWYKDKEHLSEWGADDVFEAELAQLLILAGEEAIQEQQDLGVSIVGGESANISSTGLSLFPNLVDKIAKKGIKKIQEEGQNITNKTSKKSEVIDNPTFKSGKVDVTGYNANFLIEANIQPQWQDFINTFTGAKFTVKNYASRSNTEIIHLGNTNLYKVFYGTLADSLGFNPEDAAHIFYHTIYSKSTNTPPEGEHVIHIRFAYELTGDGLYDKDGNRIDAADFFIYNDPSSENIYVRSTKAMIAEALDYIGNISDPLYSNIVILKKSFN